MSAGLRVSGLLRDTVRLSDLPRLDRIDPLHPDRGAIEAFIAGCFQRNHGATPTQYCDRLMGWRNAAGSWAGAVGYAPLVRNTAFLEHYLDQPLEQVLAARLGRPVSRDAIVEAGNLAALDAGGARILIGCLTRHLDALGYTWVALTGTRALLNSFARLGIPMETLAAADPARLPDGGKGWGNYYDTCPQVAFTDIAHAARRLAL